MDTASSETIIQLMPSFVNLSFFRLVDPYVQPILYMRTPEEDTEKVFRFPDDDPFFSEISNFIDIIEDIEEDPDAAAILSSYEGNATLYIDLGPRN